MKEYGKKHLLEFVWVGLLSVLFSAAYVGISLVLQNVIDWAIAGEVKKAVVISVCFVAIFAAIYWLQASAKVRLNMKVMQEIRAKIVAKILQKSTGEFHEHEETDYISLVQNDVKRIEDTYLETFFSAVSAFAQLIFAIIVMTNYSPVFTITMLGMTVAMFGVPAVFSKKMEKATEAVSKAQQELTQGVSEVVLGFEVIKSFQKENYRMQKFEVCNGQMKKSSKKLEILKQLNNGVSNALAFSMQMVICILAGYFIYKKALSYGSMVGVIQVSGSMTQPLFQLFSMIPALKAFQPIWEKIGDYTKNGEFLQKNTGKDAASMENLTDKQSFDWKKITLRGVAFSYSGADKTVLKDVNLDIQKGKKYLIVGESGCGKSTLVNILSGKMKPVRGQVLLDGQEEDGEKLQRLSSGVWQNVYLFNESIEENILMGDEEKADIPEVLNKAALTEVAKEKGMDFVVGTNGDQLSGGQKQRIAIARALHAKKDILILDEGFSALDAEMGEKIEKELLSKSDQTIISISHHASKEVRSLYDEIIEVRNGKIA